MNAKTETSPKEIGRKIVEEIARMQYDGGSIILDRARLFDICGLMRYRWWFSRVPVPDAEEILNEGLHAMSKRGWYITPLRRRRVSNPPELVECYYPWSYVGYEQIQFSDTP